MQRVGVAIIAREHSCNYGESKNHWSKYCRKEEHNYHRRVSIFTKLLLNCNYSRALLSLEYSRKVIDLHINQATFNGTETSKSSWKNWLEDKRRWGYYLCVSLILTVPHWKYCPLARCVLSLHVRLVLSKSPFVSSYSSSSKESPFQKCAKKAIREAWGSLTNKRINGSSLGGVSRVHSKEVDFFSRDLEKIENKCPFFWLDGSLAAR